MIGNNNMIGILYPRLLSHLSLDPESQVGKIDKKRKIPIIISVGLEKSESKTDASPLVVCVTTIRDAIMLANMTTDQM